MVIEKTTDKTHSTLPVINPDTPPEDILPTPTTLEESIIDTYMNGMQGTAYDPYASINDSLVKAVSPTITGSQNSAILAPAIEEPNQNDFLHDFSAEKPETDNDVFLIDGKIFIVRSLGRDAIFSIVITERTDGHNMVVGVAVISKVEADRIKKLRPTAKVPSSLERIINDPNRFVVIKKRHALVKEPLTGAIHKLSFKSLTNITGQQMTVGNDREINWDSAQTHSWQSFADMVDEQTLSSESILPTPKGLRAIFFALPSHPFTGVVLVIDAKRSLKILNIPFHACPV
ncbi:MAG TPA: hypothetical protein VJC18_10680 [bacterium]|nr:hypothetical protein [bacterium]